MAVEINLNTPLSEALSNVVQPKLSEVGWSTGGSDDSALGEYIILMLVNGKTQEQIAAELSNELLNLGPEDSGATDFAKWLFEQVDLLNAQINGNAGPPVGPAQQGQAIPSFHDETRHSRNSGRLDADMAEAMEDVQEGSIPTGPRSMRSGARGNNKRLMGQLSKAMDRSNDAVLHKVRLQQGTERINMHNRQPPRGPRSDQSRNQRFMPYLRPAAVGMPNGGAPGPLINATQQQQMQLFAMLEEQARMMSQIFSPQQQSFIPQPAINPNFRQGVQQPQKSLFERVEKVPQHQTSNQNTGSRNNGLRQHQSHPTDVKEQSLPVTSSSVEAESDLSPNSICRFNLKCTKKDCPFAHQSPAAPPGITMDLSAECTFGARCQNRKCVMRHPSLAQKATANTNEDCRFFPNCNNPTCPFRHPTSMPMCKFGANCNRENCKYTHVNIMCKYNPCLNPSCPYKHAEGQKRGGYDDKVWIAGDDQKKDHVSERKFVDDVMEEEELVRPENPQAASSQPPAADVVT
ncbi:MAG: hypothetical protein LQ342_001548 [Letrouitia transgressa]|nr:MAG: hypothetical protein LQ342_001548 [Letrouitia transgressa]